MARKTLEVRITDEGRDQGKVFVLTEMPASQAEKWGMRVLCILLGSGVQVPPDLANAGMAGVAMIGFANLLRGGVLEFPQLEPLLDQMMTCVSMRPDPAHPEIVRPLIEEDIDEIPTRLRLRAEVFALHTGFSSAAALWESVRSTTAAASKTTKTSPDSSGP